jgi:hypothetical protein
MISPLLLLRRRRRPFIFHEVGSPQARMCALPCGAPMFAALRGGGLWENVSYRVAQDKGPRTVRSGGRVFHLSQEGCGVGIVETPRIRGI